MRQMRLDAARGIVREPPKLLAVETRPAAALAAATGRALHTYQWEDVGARVLVTVALQGAVPPPRPRAESHSRLSPRCRKRSEVDDCISSIDTDPQPGATQGWRRKCRRRG